MRHSSPFQPDEYTVINERYFADVRQAGYAEVDPSGWIETLSEAARMVPSNGRRLSASRYYMDEGDSLGMVRDDITHLLEAWDGASLEKNQFTACPSVGMASILTMAVLRRKGVRRIVFETPCYFAAVLQAEWLGLKVEMVPTYAKHEYQLAPIVRSRRSASPFA